MTVKSSLHLSETLNHHIEEACKKAGFTKSDFLRKGAAIVLAALEKPGTKTVLRDADGDREIIW